MAENGKYNLRSPYIAVNTSGIQMNKVTFLAMIAIIAPSGIATTAGFGFTIAIAQMADNATMGNMTGGNMTMGAGNMTDGNMTESVGQISGGGGRCGGTCYTDSD